MAILAPAPPQALPARAPDAAPAGSLESAIAHHAAGAQLVARRWDAGGDPRRPRILVAVEDGPRASGLVGVAGAVAAACGGHVQLVHVAGSGYGSTTRHRLAELSIQLIALTGGEPIVDVLRGGDVATAVARFAHSSGAGLLVVGHQRQAPRRAADSVAARLADAAPCSVLVVPAPA